MSRSKNATSPYRHVDVLLVAAVLGVSALGLLMVYSATRHRQGVSGVSGDYYLKRQALFLVIGIAVMVVLILVDYRALADMAPAVYVTTVLVLLLVLSPVGSAARGSQAWFELAGFQFEPSELAKVALIICLSAYCALHRADLDAGRVMVLLALAAIPMALIYRQPDLGTDLVFGSIIIAMLLVGGARPRHLAALTIVAVVGVAAVVQLGVLKEYQVERLSAFLDPPHGDQARSAYNLHQSQIAIAAGGLHGRGLFQGTQTNLSFVPEQHTDFIFTAVGEELGFLGAASLLGLFALVVWRTWRAAVLARDRLGTLLCVGVLAMLVFQIFENVGMTMNITPITGIPLPFMSYGGSATVAEFAAVGLVLNVHMRRFS